MTDINNLSIELMNEVKSLTPRVRRIKNLLISGADINYSLLDNGYTPLMLAIEEQHYRIAEYLLHQGADPLQKNNENKIASQLISSEALLYPILKDHELLFATMNNNLDTVKSVVDAGAMINFQGPGGYTALMIAVEQDQEEMIELFLSLGADMSLTCTDGRNVFQLATNLKIRSFLEHIKTLSNAAQFIINNGTHCFFRPTLINKGAFYE